MNSRPHSHADHNIESADREALEIQGLIDAVLDGDLTPQAREVMLRRIDAYPGGRSQLDSLRRAAEALRPPVECPDFSKSVWREVSVRSALEDPLSFRASTSQWVLPLSIAAGLALVAGATLLVLGLPGGSSTGAVVPEQPLAADSTPAVVETAPPAPIATSRQQRPTSLPMGPTDQHEVRARWDKQLDPGPGAIVSARDAHVPSLPDAPQESATAAHGQIISVRVGPAWTLWWVPDSSSPQARTMQLLTRTSTPTNATVDKPSAVTPR